MDAKQKLTQAVTAYKAGDAEAFTALYQGSYKYIYTCVYKFMNDKDGARELIEDMMQETYFEIVRNIGQLKEDENFIYWASTIANRKCISYLKKNKNLVLLDEEEDSFDDFSDSEDIIPEEIMMNKETHRLLREIIDTQLTEIQRLCVIEFYYNKRKQKEIAELFEMPENTVKTNLFRAKIKIEKGVLDLEKNKDTKLYNVAPFLLLLLQEEVQSLVVPKEITEHVLVSMAAGAKVAEAVGIEEVGAKVAETAGTNEAGAKVAEMAGKGAAGAGITGTGAVASKGIIGKIVSDITKHKVISTLISLGLFGGAAGVLFGNPIKGSWESSYKEFLLSSEEAAGFDLNDFDEDGTPEMLVKETDGDVTVYQYMNRTVSKVREFVANTEKSTDGVLETYASQYGYGMDYDQIIELDDWSGVYNGNTYQLPTMAEYKYFPGEFVQTDIVTASLIGSSKDVEFGYHVDMEGRKKSLSKEDGADLVEQAENEFNEIQYTNIESSKIDARIEEFKANGNRPRTKDTDETVEETEDFVENSSEQEKEEEKEQDAYDKLKNILLYPEEYREYYPSDADISQLWFAVADIDADEEDEVIIGDKYSDINQEPGRIINILDTENGQVIDYDGEQIYENVNEFTLYDTNILKSYLWDGWEKTCFWNLQTGEVWKGEKARPVEETMSLPAEQREWHAYLTNQDGKVYEGEEGDALYSSLCEGTEIPLEWKALEEENILYYFSNVK